MGSDLAYGEIMNFINGIGDDDKKSKSKYELIAQNIGSINNIYEALRDIDTCGVDGKDKKMGEGLPRRMAAPSVTETRAAAAFEKKYRNALASVDANASKSLEAINSIFSPTGNPNAKLAEEKRVSDALDSKIIESDALDSKIIESDALDSKIIELLTKIGKDPIKIKKNIHERRHTTTISEKKKLLAVWQEKLKIKESRRIHTQNKMKKVKNAMKNVNVNAENKSATLIVNAEHLHSPFGTFRTMKSIFNTYYQDFTGKKTKDKTKDKTSFDHFIEQFEAEKIDLDKIPEDLPEWWAPGIITVNIKKNLEQSNNHTFPSFFFENEFQQLKQSYFVKIFDKDSKQLISYLCVDFSFNGESKTSRENFENFEKLIRSINSIYIEIRRYFFIDKKLLINSTENDLHADIILEFYPMPEKCDIMTGGNKRSKRKSRSKRRKTRKTKKTRKKNKRTKKRIKKSR